MARIARILDEDQPKNIIGPNVRKYRLQKGWSQQHFANKLELIPIYICRGSISRMEEQVRTVTDFEAAGIAEALGVSIMDLFKGEDA